ncbi:MAG: hypothetical protein ABSB79_12610 [Syntrophales bacterium]|jgi:hypothetical protein
MKIFSVLLSVIIFLFVFTTAESVNAKARIAKKKEIIVSMDAQKLPKEFVGDNKIIAKIMNAHYFEKSKYETNEAYEQRKKAVEDKVYVFSHDEGEYRDELVYDAEEKTLVVTISPRMPKDMSEIIDNLKPSYIGQNAFGARKQVFAGNWYNYRLEIPLPSYKYYFPMEPEKAKIFRQGLSLLIWVKILNVERDTQYMSATYNVAIDGAHIQYNGKASIVEMWLYDFDTGEIYKKLNADGKPIGT